MIFTGDAGALGVRSQRILLCQVDQLLNGALDEYDGDEESKVFLGEPGDVTDQSAGIQSHAQDQEKANPEPDPTPERQKVPAKVGADLIDDGFKHQNGSCWSDYRQWLSRKESIDNANHASTNQGLNDRDVLLSGFTQKTT